MGIREKFDDAARAACAKAAALKARARTIARDERGQGTAEYAILIGVIVIIAVVAVLLFGDKLAQMWNAANGQMDNVLSHGFSGQSSSGTIGG